MNTKQLQYKTKFPNKLKQTNSSTFLLRRPLNVCVRGNCPSCLPLNAPLNRLGTKVIEENTASKKNARTY